MKYYLGLDVGGTNLAAGVVDENGKIIIKSSMKSGAGRSVNEITNDFISISKSVMELSGISKKDFEYLGIGMPSTINARTGKLVHANCFGWRNIPIMDYLKDKIDLPIKIENDANCAVLAETKAGAAKGFNNALMLTLGTGLGGGIVIDGKLYTGADGMGAELGHTKMVYGGVRCTCGQYGCAESYCSATALINQAKEMLLCEEKPKESYHETLACKANRQGQKQSMLYEMAGENLELLDAEMIFSAAKGRDKLAITIINNYIDYLACAISSFVTIFRPEIIVLGGGVANAGDYLIKPLRETLEKNTFSGAEIGVPPIVRAELGNNAGIIGAAMLGA